MIAGPGDDLRQVVYELSWPVHGYEGGPLRGLLSAQSSRLGRASAASLSGRDDSLRLSEKDLV
jgi:hypothetical protein